jgi:glycerate 2-kinase
MKVVLAPDSFKGSLCAGEVCAAMAEGIRCATPDAQIVSIPMADGGEGITAALVTATGGTMRHVKVTGPLGDSIEAFFGILGGMNGRAAVIETASAAGLPLVPAEKRDPRKTTTYEVVVLAGSIGDGAELMLDMA